LSFNITGGLWCQYLHRQFAIHLNKKF
jgi:hypothetical protein